MPIKTLVFSVCLVQITKSINLFELSGIFACFFLPFHLWVSRWVCLLLIEVVFRCASVQLLDPRDAVRPRWARSQVWHFQVANFEVLFVLTLTAPSAGLADLRARAWPALTAQLSADFLPALLEGWRSEVTNYCFETPGNRACSGQKWKTHKNCLLSMNFRTEMAQKVSPKLYFGIHLE